MKVNIIKVSWGSAMESIVLFPNLMSTTERRIGVSLRLTFQLLGWICKLKVSSYPVTFLRHFSALQRLHSFPLLIQWHLL